MFEFKIFKIDIKNWLLYYLVTFTITTLKLPEINKAWHIILDYLIMYITNKTRLLIPIDKDIKTYYGNIYSNFLTKYQKWQELYFEVGNNNRFKIIFY